MGLAMTAGGEGEGGDLGGARSGRDLALGGRGQIGALEHECAARSARRAERHDQRERAVAGGQNFAVDDALADQRQRSRGHSDAGVRRRHEVGEPCVGRPQRHAGATKLGGDHARALAEQRVGVGRLGRA
ncbi:MAG: hypothetical protein DWI16_01620 [Planctomycetota bacterium]|nr:MAG: hypothetical protein DWI16_01620 [Planctomycetota bacterium]